MSQETKGIKQHATISECNNPCYFSSENNWLEAEKKLIVPRDKLKLLDTNAVFASILEP